MRIFLSKSILVFSNGERIFCEFQFSLEMKPFNVAKVDRDEMYLIVSGQHFSTAYIHYFPESLVSCDAGIDKWVVFTTLVFCWCVATQHGLFFKRLCGLEKADSLIQYPPPVSAWLWKNKHRIVCFCSEEPRCLEPGHAEYSFPQAMNRIERYSEICRSALHVLEENIAQERTLRHFTSSENF